MENFFLDITTAMQSQQWFYFLTVGLVSLCIGSFLNVVIYRLPLMMKREWQTECRLVLADELNSKQQTEQAPFNLVKPNSSCPKCKAPIKAWQNIPASTVVGFSWRPPNPSSRSDRCARQYLLPQRSLRECIVTTTMKCGLRTC